MGYENMSEDKDALILIAASLRRRINERERGIAALKDELRKVEAKVDRLEHEQKERER